jgi:hypothetical protein
MSTKVPNVRMQTLIDTVALLVHSLTDAYATIADLNYQVASLTARNNEHVKSERILQADYSNLQEAYNEQANKYVNAIVMDNDKRRTMFIDLFASWGNLFTFRTTYHSGPNPSKISGIKEFRQVLSDHGLKVSLLDAKVCVETLFAEWDTWNENPDPWAKNDNPFDATNEPPF